MDRVLQFRAQNKGKIHYESPFVSGALDSYATGAQTNPDGGFQQVGKIAQKEATLFVYRAGSQLWAAEVAKNTAAPSKWFRVGEEGDRVAYPRQISDALDSALSAAQTNPEGGWKQVNVSADRRRFEYRFAGDPRLWVSTLDESSPPVSSWHSETPVSGWLLSKGAR